MAPSYAKGARVPALLELEPNAGNDRLGPPPSTVREVALVEEPRAARARLRRQIARMERDLGELFATTFPRLGIEWNVGAAGGPRVLGMAELERTRDALADRLAEARAEIARRADEEQESRELVERMIADPAEYRWVRVRNEDVGEPSCKHWHSSPRWGIVGMFMGWWRVKLSSGCPLATGRRRLRRPPRDRDLGLEVGAQAA